MYHPMFKKPLYGVLVALLGLLVGCSAPLKTIRLLPPNELVQDCIAPEVVAGTNKDLANSIILLGDALELCNIDKKALRDWANKSEK